MVVMKNMLIKDTLREIRHTKSRFISILLIVALGVSFFAGVKATCPDMKITADKYFDDYNLMDIRLLSTMGFKEQDIEAIKGADGVLGVFPTYSMDAVTDIQDKDIILKVMALPLDKLNGSDASYINRTKLLEGRYPTKPNECLAERRKFSNAEMSIGSTIKLSSGTDKDITESLKETEFTIVGIVETPYYITFERGTTTLGSGKIDNFIIIPQENFKSEYYTEVLLTVKGAKELLTYNDEYDDVIEPVKNSLKDIGKERAKARYEEVIKEADEELDKGKKELADAEKKQKEELAKAQTKLNDARKQISDGEKKLKDKEALFNKTIKDAEAKIAKGYKDLETGEKDYAKQLESFKLAKKASEEKFAQAEAEIAAGQAELDKNEAELNNLKLLLSSNPNLPEAKQAEIKAIIETSEPQLALGKQKLEASKKQLEAGKKQIAEGKAKLTAARNTLDSSKVKLNSESKRLEREKKKAEAEFAKARKKLEDSKAELLKGEKDYEEGKKESDEKIADAKVKISDAEKEIAKIKEPEWYVLDRNMHLDFVDYEKAADRIDAIAEVFPVFFFLVAALVCLTTMTRMVDEQRIHIGTLKALGYSKASIASKYLFYAFFASIIGSVLGFTIGFKVFPTVIYNAYRILYIMPSVITEFNVTYAVISTSFAVLATTLATFFAVYKELMIEPAALMRPKAPKSGKRIFLERVKFLWSRLNFTQKVTARNLFRYKKRFLMTTLGIGGCTALLLAGFGLKDSIVDIAAKQFDEIYEYDMAVNFKDSFTMEDASKYIDNIKAESRITDYILIKQQNIDVGTDKNEKTASLIVPENTEKMKNFIKFKTRTTEEEVPFNNDGVILTEKLAKMLEVNIGDEIYIKDGDTSKLKFKVSGITEHYVAHYVYMPPKLYEEAYGKKLEFGQLIAKTTGASKEFEEKLSKDLLKNKEISSINFTTGTSKSFNDMLGSLDYVVLVLIISAGALAFVVLYNLTNINITERLREIATIKVLGFFDSEVSAYVYRENIFLTLIGMVFGLILGIFLHKFIIITAEIDYVMFGRQIKNLSYLYSSVLTIFFSVLVNFVMYFKLKKVNMVESLKSVD